MTFIARDNQMLSHERISGLAVIELGLVGNVPALRIVAVLAVRTKFPFVHISVAIGALNMRNRLVPGIMSVIGWIIVRDDCMTFVAHDRCMFA